MTTSEPRILIRTALTDGIVAGHTQAIDIGADPANPRDHGDAIGVTSGPTLAHKAPCVVCGIRQVIHDDRRCGAMNDLGGHAILPPRKTLLDLYEAYDVDVRVDPPRDGWVQYSPWSAEVFVVDPHAVPVRSRSAKAVWSNTVGTAWPLVADDPDADPIADVINGIAADLDGDAEPIDF